jgi:hypothetical protein
MPSASEFSTTPASNTTIGGVNVGEDCSPGGINDALRYLAAAARDSFDKIPATGAYIPASGGTYTGDIYRYDRGGYLHHASTAQYDGRVFFLPEGSARPAAAEGAIVFYYS